MKILVTGGAGFIASHLVDNLITAGHQVVVVDNLLTGNRLNINPQCIYYNADIALYNELSEVFDRHRFDTIYHHAAQIHVQRSIKEPSLDATINILGTINILECAKKHNVRKIIYPSSAAVYGTPQYLPIDEQHPMYPESCYGISKLTPEYYLRTYSQLYGIDYTILRYANVYGQRQDPRGEGGVISVFIERIINDEPITVYGDGLQTRDFIYVKDVVNANLASLYKGSGMTMNISSNSQISLNQLISILGEVSGKSLHPQYIAPRSGDIRHSCLINYLACTELEWKPQYDLFHGLKETMQHSLAHQYN